MDKEYKFVKLNDTIIKLQIWDTAGQERYRSMTRRSYQNADAVLLLYDVTSKDSFNSIHNWIKDIKTNSREEVVMLLLGNKIDSNERVMMKEDGEKLASSYNTSYFECSVKYDINVTESIIYLVQEIFQKGEIKKNILLEDKKLKKEKKGCC